ncbi:MAG: glycosyltransferase family 2 protein, partial [Bacteroidota bacterium]
MTISVIISAYNEESIIRQRIENLLSLDYPKEKVEILIGSDGSSDGTNAIAAEYASQNVTLIAFPDRRGKASVLNDLALKANNEILIFSDANTFYDKNVFKNFVRHFSDESIGGVCGYLQLRSSDDNSGGKGESFYWEYENRIKELEGNYHTTFGATGAIYAIRKHLFRPLPAAIAITDDFLIPMNVVAQGYRIIYDKTVYGWEDSTESSMKEFHRKIRISAGNFNCLKDIIHLLHPKYGFIAFGFFSHKIIRWFV